MTDRKDALTELLANIEAGHGNDPSDYLCLMIVNDSIAARNAYSGSLDAAKALHEAVLQGWDFSLGANYAEVADYPNRCGVYFIGTSDTPARAWLIAILKALIANAKKPLDS
jgi:hypothetical protein|tara:strand:- start:405 stop:740 length:336 start_codon:yes stop_codon:yes gene_type:complete